MPPPDQEARQLIDARLEAAGWQDQDFARRTLLPLADPLIAFLDQYWQKRDANGKIIFDPAQSLETWHVAVNPLPEIVGLRFLLPRLLALPKNITTEAQRSRWTQILQELPPVPAADVEGVKLLRPADSFSGRSNSENPELYTVFPFRICGVGKPNMEIGRETFAGRVSKAINGWNQSSIQAACLGLTDEAKGMLVTNASSKHDGSRFPAFWGPNYDWIPDQCHGGNILNTTQTMLMQTEGRWIILFPAWSKERDVSFKLHAPSNTTVEGELHDGKVTSLTVTPKSRAADVVNMLAK